MLGEAKACLMGLATEQTVFRFRAKLTQAGSAKGVLVRQAFPDCFPLFLAIPNKFKFFVTESQK